MYMISMHACMHASTYTKNLIVGSFALLQAPQAVLNRFIALAVGFVRQGHLDLDAGLRLCVAFQALMHLLQAQSGDQACTHTHLHASHAHPPYTTASKHTHANNLEARQC